ncbi:hypothetical protein SCALM49S_01537 [Streptomyces californicus]
MPLVSPTAAFPHDHELDPLERLIAIDGVDHPYFDQLVWAGLPTMPGLPATAVPAGRSPEGLPVGVQLIGPMYEDRTPLRLAELLEEAMGGFEAPGAQGLRGGSGSRSGVSGRSGGGRGVDGRGVGGSGLGAVAVDAGGVGAGTAFVSGWPRRRRRSRGCR